jgi:hypothetical protein
VRKIARPVHEAARDKARAINVTLPLGMLRHLQTTCRYNDTMPFQSASAIPNPGPE